MAGIPLSSQFNLSAQLPLDSRIVVSNITERDAIDSVQRYEGLQCYVTADSKNYQLVGGIDNLNWVELNSGGGSSLLAYTETFIVDGIILANGYVVLIHTPNLINEHIFVIHNGLILEEGDIGDDVDYTIDVKTITLTNLILDDKILIKYKA